MNKTEIREYLAKIGAKGGNTTKQRHGSSYFKRISQLGVIKRWQKNPPAKDT